MNKTEIKLAFDNLVSKYKNALEQIQQLQINAVKVDNTKIDQLTIDNQNLKKLINDLQKQLNEKPKEIEKIIEVEKIIEKPVEIEKAATGDLREAARLMAASELNKEDLSVQEIYDLLQKSSAEDVRKKIGFWAMPLPKDTDKPETTKRYIGKK